MMRPIFIRSFLLATILLATITNCNTGANMLGGGSSLMKALGSKETLSIFTQLLQTPGLDKLIGNVLKEPFTMLAPTNDALNSAGTNTVSDLMKPDNLSKLGDLVKGHVVPGKLNPSDLTKGGLKNAGGNPLNLSGVNLGEVMGDEKFNIIPIDKLLK